MKAKVKRKLKVLGGKKYYVQEDGVIISYASGKELKQRFNADGYLEVTVGKEGKRRTVRVHRIVAEAFVPIPRKYQKIPRKYLEVHHKDGNRANPHVSNLEWVTHQENVRRAYERGSYNRKGINNGRAMFAEADVLAIRKMYALGVRQAELAKLYGRGWSTIHNIVNGLTWTHI